MTEPDPLLSSQRPDPGRRLAVSATGWLLQMLICSVPLLVFADADDWLRSLPVLLTATLLYVADQPRSFVVGPDDRVADCAQYAAAALAGGLLLLGLQWSCQAELLIRSPADVPTWLVGTGLTVGILGCVLRFLAVATLGSRFGSGPHVGLLQTDGVYRKLRHPSEAGLLLACGGTVLATGTWTTGLILLPLIALASQRRIQIEERWLQQQFSDDFLAYKSQTARWF